MRIGLYTAGILGTLLGACQCGEQLVVLAPKIEIGDPYDPSFSVCATDFVKDCAYDFNTVAIGRPKLFSFVIKNPSSVDLTINSIVVDGSPNFSLEGEIPDRVEAAIGGTGKIVTVKYNPQTETSETANIVIASDAKNLAEGENVIIALNATGVDPGCPVATVDPPRCDFGNVGVGVRAQCTLSIKNEGNVELEITDIGFTPDTPTPGVFGPDSVFPIPTFVQSGTATSVAFYAVPNVASEITGGLVVTTNDCATPTVNVPFVVRGASSPTAVARVKSINGTPNTSATPAVEPLDNVVLSGDQSVPGATGAVITAWQWTITDKPPESTVRLSNANAVDTHFEFDSASGVVQGLDVAGTFRISLVVTDSNGGSSSNDATVTLNAVPTEGLHVQLSWSASVDDIDLHVARGNSPDWCSSNDCYYGNCQGTFSSLNWDTQPGFTPGDPRLQIDDLEGFGPEDTSIESPLNGTYTIGVHAYSGNGSTSGFTPTDIVLKVFVGGALVQSFNGHLQNTDDFWTVGQVQVNGGSSVTSVDTMESGWDCF